MPSHNDTDFSRAHGLNILSGRLGTTRKVLDDDYNVEQFGPVNIFLDPNGSDREVTLPPLIEGGGLFFIIANLSTGNFLTVRSANGLEVEVVQPRQMMMFVSDEAEWITTAGLAKAAGPDHRVGQVPDPGPVLQAIRFLREDMEWGSVFVSGVVDAFKFMTDGVNTATGTGPDTFKFRSSLGTIAPVVGNNDVTHGDNVDLNVVPSAIDHNALLNYSANRHIDHTAVNLTAGVGLSGGGDISASRSFAIDFSEFTVVVPTLLDYATFHDVSTGLPGAALWSGINSILVHNNLSGYVANEHINHSSVGITAGVGLSGGGDLTATRTLNLDFTEFDALDAITAADLVPYYDVSESDHGTVTVAQFNAALDHNTLLNYDANRHIDHTGVTLTAGAGLTGGGTIAASRTFAVGAGLGITVNADDVAISTNGVTLAMMAQIATARFLGRTTAGTGDVESLTVTQATALLNAFTGDAGAGGVKGLVPAPGAGDAAANKFLHADGTFKVPSGAVVADGDKGDITVSSSGTVWTIDNNAVSYAKMQDISATARILGRKTAGSGDPEECTLTEILDFVSGSIAWGDMIFRGSAGWQRLPPGAVDRVLQTNGAGVNPTWTGIIPVTATQAQQEAAVHTTNFVTPAIQQFHDSACKFWMKCGPTGTVSASYNLTSITDGASGIQTANVNVDFSSANWAAFVDSLDSGTSGFINITSQAAGTLGYERKDAGGVLEEAAFYYAGGFGDQ